MSAQTQLATLILFGNGLSDIDLSALTQLTELGLSSNQLTAIDLSTQAKLTVLWVDDNPLSEASKLYLNSLNGVNGLTIIY